ncbi:hypothetical protein GW777_05090, partial [Candidatus Peregrinibacteria bacterium]|nr:hypothetical protein [Candidatus Peregrinibacteria bacterium]
SDGVILDVVTAREKVGLFASALAESLQFAFPGEAIGQSIQAFMLNPPRQSLLKGTLM